MTEPATPAEDPRWLALSKARQQKLLTQYRDINVCYDWWDFLYDDFEEDLEEVGIEVVDYKDRKEIYFSGFYCQGDGARFVGVVVDVEKFLTAMDRIDLLPWWKAEGWSAKSRLIGNSMTTDLEFLLPENPYDLGEEPLQHHTWNIVKKLPTQTDIDDFAIKVDEKFDALAAELYVDLRNEYEHQTSDDQVVAWILSNAEHELCEEDD